MALHGEPKNGDYVAYIEALVNRGRASPGQVGQAAARRGGWVDALRPAGASADPDDAVQWPADGGFAPAGTMPAPDSAYPPPDAPDSTRPGRGRAARPGKDALPRPAEAQGRPATLAQAAAQRKQGLMMMGIAAVLAVVAFNMAGAAMAARGGFDDFLPALFLAVFAFIFLRGGLRLRRGARAAQPALPPLSTIPASSRQRPPR